MIHQCKKACVRGRNLYSSIWTKFLYSNPNFDAIRSTCTVHVDSTRLLCTMKWWITCMSYSRNFRSSSSYINYDNIKLSKYYVTLLIKFPRKFLSYKPLHQLTSWTWISFTCEDGTGEKWKFVFQSLRSVDLKKVAEWRDKKMRHLSHRYPTNTYRRGFLESLARSTTQTNWSTILLIAVKRSTIASFLFHFVKFDLSSQ